MRLSETRNLFVSSFDFPVERATVIEQVGEVEIDAPTGDADDIESVLTRTDQETFDTAEELHDVITTFVGEQYIGRKFYDDRGANLRTDLDEVHF